MTVHLVQAEIQKRLSAKRFQHTLGTAECAVALARRFGANEDDAYLAGLLHDCTKEWQEDAQLNFFEKHGIMICNTQKLCPQLHHAVSGAIVAKEEFGASDEVCGAIRWHTTGHVGMTKLEMVLWLADLIEPGRSFPEVEELRALAEKDLTVSVRVGMDRSIRYLLEKNQLIDPEMVNARNWLLEYERK